MVHALDEVFTIIHARLRSAQQRFHGAQDDHMTRYYKGQVDTLPYASSEASMPVSREIQAVSQRCLRKNA